jgi:hypothetical protein
MTDAPSDADPPCHNMTERECKLVKQIEKSVQTYDQLEASIRELIHVLQNNDWYFVTHMAQIRSDAHGGRKQRESYMETLEVDSQRYVRELEYIGSIIRRAMTMVPLREIRLVGDDDPDAPAP